MFFLIKINKFIKISNSNFEFHNKNFVWVLLLVFFFKCFSSPLNIWAAALLYATVFLTVIAISRKISFKLIVILIFVYLLNIFLIIKSSSTIFLLYLLLLVFIGVYLLTVWLSYLTGKVCFLVLISRPNYRKIFLLKQGC